MIVNPAPSQYEGFSIRDATGTESVVLQDKAASWVKTLSVDGEDYGTNWSCFLGENTFDRSFVLFALLPTFRG